jgi:hypothetical protein
MTVFDCVVFDATEGSVVVHAGALSDATPFIEPQVPALEFAASFLSVRVAEVIVAP